MELIDLEASSSQIIPPTVQLEETISMKPSTPKKPNTPTTAKRSPNNSNSSPEDLKKVLKMDLDTLKVWISPLSYCIERRGC